MNIIVYCGANTGKDPIFQKTAENLGGWIADQGHSLVYGGGKAGLMGVVFNLVFWLGLIAGILWLLKYFKVFAMFN